MFCIIEAKGDLVALICRLILHVFYVQREPYLAFFQEIICRMTVPSQLLRMFTAS